MSPRKNRRTPSGPGPSGGGGSSWTQRTEEGSDGDWNVRMVSGSSAAKQYRCPGCDQLIPAGVGHVVAWPADGRGGADDRRHWHRPCWQARERRAPRTMRSRGAPRY
ncbi:ATP/GTP-binding protein [Actinomadura sp. 9N407]|uniref:ATP/GTP-binding protein n=1 Tax=Actinomadura sp. 9N407 TaxID=3375154 RepID=UPI0037B7A233